MFWAIAALLFFFLAYLLLAPVSLEVSSSQGLLRIRIFHIASASLFDSGDPLLLKINVLGWKKYIDLRQVRKHRRKKANVHAHHAVPPLRKILAVLRSFRTRGVADIDTGSMPLNGILYPAVLWLRRRTGWPLFINFNGRLFVELEIRNSVARMAWAYVKS